MRLNEAGRTFLKEARSILSQSQRAVHLAQAASRGEAGQLDIAYAVEGFEPVLLRVIRLFRQLFPMVELGIREMQYHQQIQKLIHQRIDIRLRCRFRLNCIRFHFRAKAFQLNGRLRPFFSSKSLLYFPSANLGKDFGSVS